LEEILKTFEIKIIEEVDLGKYGAWRDILSILRKCRMSKEFEVEVTWGLKGQNEYGEI
jgi:hypothetical protein